MKLQTNTKALAKALNIVSKAILSKNSIMIFESAKLSSQGGKFYLTGGNTEYGITIPVEMSLVSGDFIEVMLPMGQFPAILASLPNITITFDFVVSSRTPDGQPDGIEINAQYFGGSFSLVTTSAQNYPVYTREASADDFCFRVPAETFLYHIRQCQSFCAPDEMKTISNVCIDVHMDDITFVGTDGKVLYKYVYDPKMDKEHDLGGVMANKEVRLMLRPSVVPALVSAFSGDDIIEISGNGNYCTLNAGDASAHVTLSEGRYPNYQAILPKYSTRIVVDKAEFISRLKRIGIFSSSATGLIKLTVSGLLLEIETEDVDYSRKAKEEISILDNNLPGNITIGMKCSNISSVLSCLETENAVIELGDATRPVLLKNEETSNIPFTGLCMPMLIE